MSVQRICLDMVVFDAGTQVRSAIDQQVVSDYAEAMSEGAVFPPIVLFHDGNQRYLADGFHRFMAAQRLQFREMDADVLAGTKADALWFALGANRTNGKRLTEADKSHAVEIALNAWPERMQREIAEQVGCSESLVSKVGLRIARNTGVVPELRGRDLAIQKKREQIREMVVAGVQSVEIRRQLKAHPTVIAEVRRELGKSGTDRSRSAVAARRMQIQEMAVSGHTSRQIAEATGLDERTVSGIAKKERIVIHADRVVRGTHRHDSNRIISQIVLDAENLTEGVNLIEFDELDRTQIAGWLQSLQESREKLGGLIRRLMKEQQEHGQVA